MTIQAVRFQDLSKDFNVASTTFSAIRDNVVMNAPEINLSSITDAAKSALDQLKGLNQSVKSGLGEADTLIKDATRVTKNLYDSFLDLSKLPESKVSELINQIMPGEMSGVTNALKGMTKVCRNKAMGAGLPFGKMQNTKCDGMSIGTNNCSAESGSVLGRALTGTVNGLLTSVGNIVGKIMSLANLGFNANMCKILGGLLEGVTSKSIIGTSLSMLANQQGRKGNFNAIRDIANNANIFGVNLGKIVPDTISNIVSGVTSFGLNFKNDKETAHEVFEASLESIDATRYEDTEGTSMASVERFQGATRIYTSSTRDTLAGMDFDEEDLDAVPDAESTKIAIAMSSQA